MHKNANQLFHHLWNNYLEVAPSAKKINALLGSTQHDDIVNDHIALRTFNLNRVKLEVLAEHFINLGFKECGDYHFVHKKLRAKHFEHPTSELPKVFISELLIEECSPQLQSIVKSMLKNITKTITDSDNFLYSGTHWSIDFATYQQLLKESEFAAWLAAWGFRANHFTISGNHLTNFHSLESINQTLKNANFQLNTSGGEIKGSRIQMLEQSSTLSDIHPVKFSNSTHLIPSCFYEFCMRYPQSNGNLFTGFIASSADKIFESTNSR